MQEPTFENHRVYVVFICKFCAAVNFKMGSIDYENGHI